MRRFMIIRLCFGTIILFLALASGTCASDFSSVNIHGIISQGYIKSTDNNFLGDTVEGTFEFNEMGINFTTEVTDRLDMGVQFFAQDKGYYGNDEILVDWAFARYRMKDYFGILCGKVKGIVGLYAEVRDIDSLRTFILLPQSTYMETMREGYAGLKCIGIYGNLPFDISYKFLYGTGGSSSGYLNSGLPFIIGGVASNMIPKNEKFRLILPEIDFTFNFTQLEIPTGYSMAAIEWRSPLEGLRFMISGGRAKFELDMSMDISSQNNSILNLLELSGAERVNNTSVRVYDSVDIWGIHVVFSIEYIWHETTVIAEYSSYSFDANEMGKLNPYGYYISLSQRITDWLCIGAYYNYQLFDPDDRNGKEYENATGYPAYWTWFEDVCIAFQFDINLNWIAKAEAHCLDGIWQVDVFDREKGKDTEREWFMFCFKLSYSF